MKAKAIRYVKYQWAMPEKHLYFNIGLQRIFKAEMAILHSFMKMLYTPTAWSHYVYDNFNSGWYTIFQ